MLCHATFVGTPAVGGVLRFHAQFQVYIPVENSLSLAELGPKEWFFEAFEDSLGRYTI